MLYSPIDCPICGNETVAKSIRGPQTCKWCKRKFVVKIKSFKNKFIWDAMEYDE